MVVPQINFYNVRQFIKYLFLDPWTTKIRIFSMKNLVNLFFLAGLVSIFYINPFYSLGLFLISFIIECLITWRSGIFLEWNRKQLYEKLNLTKKKAKEFKNNQKEMKENAGEPTTNVVPKPVEDEPLSPNPAETKLEEKPKDL